MSCLSYAFLMLMFSCQTVSQSSAQAPLLAADSLEHILQQNNTAMSGSEAWEQVENLRIELDIREPGFEVLGTYLASRERAMRIDVMAGGKRIFAEGLYQGAAWKWTPDAGYSSANEEGRAALRHGIEGPGKFYTLLQFRDRGGKVSLSNPGLLASANEWQLEFLLPDGQRVYHFIDKNTCLSTREVTRRAFHPDVQPDAATIESRFSDPMIIDGILRFKTIESRDLETGEWLGTTHITSIEHNVAVPNGFYSGAEAGRTQSL